MSNLPAASVPLREIDLVWLLVYSAYPWQRYLPVPVPVKGTFDKAGKNIKTFGKGFANIRNENLLNTPDRQQLYNLSEAMYMPLKERYKFEPEDFLSGEIPIAQNFHQWEQALPMLCEQSFVYKYHLAHPRFFMKRAPGWKYLERITISMGRPQLQFILKDKGNYYQLSMQYLIQGIPLKNPMEDALFFVSNATEYFLLASLRDAAIVQWMRNFDNRISALKPGFPAFEKEILKRIESMYTL